jgi:predicted nuclease of predicted toxin-antitoxin system
VIAGHAEAQGMTLISKDEDFIVLRLPDRFAFIWLRCGNATNRAPITWLEPRWEEIAALLARGERFIEVR